MAEGLLLILSGPSGVGKGTVCRSLLELKPMLRLSVSMTTRPPRPGEVNGGDYHFTGPKTFQKMIENNEFLEWAVVHGHYYGTPRSEANRILTAGTDLLLEIDIQGARQVRRAVPGVVSIFLAPPSEEALRERIAGRSTEDGEEIRRRLETARQEMTEFQFYEYLVINDIVEKAALQLSAVIDAEKCRVGRGARPPLWGGEEW